MKILKGSWEIKAPTPCFPLLGSNYKNTFISSACWVNRLSFKKYYGVKRRMKEESSEYITTLWNHSAQGWVSSFYHTEVHRKNDKWTNRRKDKFNTQLSARAACDPNSASSSHCCQFECSHWLHWTWIRLLCFWNIAWVLFYHTTEPNSVELLGANLIVNSTSSLPVSAASWALSRNKVNDHTFQWCFSAY